MVARSTAELLAQGGFPTWYVGAESPSATGVVTLPSHCRAFYSRQGEGSRVAGLRYLFNEMINVGHATAAGLRSLRNVRPEVVISNHPLTTILLRLLYPRMRLLYRMHDGIHTQNGAVRYFDRILRFFTSEALERIAVGLASYVVSPGDRVRQELLALGVPHWKVCSLYPIVGGMLGVEEVPREPGGGPIAANGIGSDLRFVLSIGQQTGRKRFDLLMEAIRHTVKDLDLVLVGDGPLHRHYQELVEALGLGRRVRFITNASDRIVQDLYRDCTIFTLVSEGEGFPVTVAEALSTGVPAIYACPSAVNSTPSMLQGLIVEGSLPTAVELGRLLDSAVDAIESGRFPTRERIRTGAMAMLTTYDTALTAYRSAFDEMGVQDAPAA